MRSHFLVALFFSIVACQVLGETRVPVQTLGELAVYPERSAPATVISLNETVISSQLAAQIKAIPVLVGDQVKKGAELVSLDCADYRINLRAAQARLRLAQSQLARFEKLLVQQLASQEAVDASESDLAVALAEKDRAQLAVDRCSVTAPFDALVTERIAARGQLANVGTELVRLLDQNSIELSAQVKTGDAEYLLNAKSLRFENGRQWPVAIRSLLSAINSATRNREVRLSFTEDTPLPGVSGRLVWRDPRPFLPARFIVQREGRLGVFLAENGQAKFMVLEDAQPGRDHPLELPLETLLVAVNLSTLNEGDPLPNGVD